MHALPSELLILLAAAVAAVALLHRLRLPALLGYLLVGAALGPHALGWLADTPAVRLLGEVGVAFLLFAIGLEFSLPRFVAMRGVLFGLGGAQVLAGTLTGALIAWLLGLPWPAALVVGGALAMSSTAIVIRQLAEQGELSEPHGRLALGILLFQDLAAVPFLVAIPLLAGDRPDALAWALLAALGKAFVALAALLLTGRVALRPLFRVIAATRSAELFTLTVLLVALLAAALTAALGLSLALGAFLAGMMLGETEYRHQIESDIRPFRDLLLGLFFVTVGMYLDPAALPPLWGWIALLIVGLVLGKGLLIALLAWPLSGDADGASATRPHRTALRTGLTLAHGGEFGLALLSLALGTGLIAAADLQPVLAAIVLSMLIAPLLIRYNLRFVAAPRRAAPVASSSAATAASAAPSPPVSTPPASPGSRSTATRIRCARPGKTARRCISATPRGARRWPRSVSTAPARWC